MKRLLILCGLIAGLVVNVGMAAAEECDCPANRICLWEHGNYQGKLFTTALASIANYQDYNFPGSSQDVNDDVSSLFNNTSKWVVFFRDSNYGDKAICVGPGKKHPRLGDFVFNPICGSPCGTMDNRLSSHKTYASRPDASLCSWTVN